MPKAKKSSSGTLEKLLPVLLVVTILLAFAVGALWQKVSFLEQGTGKVVSNTTGGTQDGNAPPPPNEPPPSGKLEEEQVEKIPQVSSFTVDSGEGKDTDDVQLETGDHVRGSGEARVFLIEYSDYECPFCQKFHPTMQRVMEEYGDDVAWVYRHYPLEFLHAKAKPAAEAAECVAELAGNDAFWEYTDKLFEDSPASLNNLEDLAVEVGVNAGEFSSCVDSGRHADKVQEQMDGGSAAGITGTPGTFVVNTNGEVWLVPGALPFESLKTTIDKALQS